MYIKFYTLFKQIMADTDRKVQIKSDKSMEHREFNEDKEDEEMNDIETGSENKDTEDHKADCKEDAHVGIDFGTTSVSAAFVRSMDDEPQLIQCPEGKFYWSSTIRFIKKHQIEYGVSTSRDPERTIYDNKRFFGRFWDEVKEFVQEYPYIIEKNPKDGGVRYRLYDKEGNVIIITPHEVASLHLRHLWVNIIAPKLLQMGDFNIHTMLTVPGYFSENQKRATKLAGLWISIFYAILRYFKYIYIYIHHHSIYILINIFVLHIADAAGIPNVVIGNEPISAAVSARKARFNEYNKEVIKSGLYTEMSLIIDIGGGTSDVSKLAITGTKMDDVLCDDSNSGYEDEEGAPNTCYAFKTKAVGGVSKLGGRDIDQELCTLVLEKIKNKSNNIKWDDISQSRKIKFNAKILKKCEDLKKKLSLYESSLCEVELPGGEEIEVAIARSELVPIIAKLFGKFIPEINKCIGKDKIDKVIYVGGTAKPSLVRTYLNSKLPDGIQEEGTTEERDQVARGAAIQCCLLQTGDPCIVFTLCAGCTLGIALKDDKYKVLVEQNTELPYRNEYKHFTNGTACSTIDIALMEGDNQLSYMNRELQRSTIDYKVLQEPRSMDLSVSVTVNRYGHIKAILYDEANPDLKAEVKHTLDLAIQEVDGALKDRFEHEDKIRRNHQQINKYRNAYIQKIYAGTFVLPEDLVKTYRERDTTSWGTSDFITALKEIQNNINFYNDQKKERVSQSNDDATDDEDTASVDSADEVKSSSTKKVTDDFTSVSNKQNDVIQDDDIVHTKSEKHCNVNKHNQYVHTDSQDVHTDFSDATSTIDTNKNVSTMSPDDINFNEDVNQQQDEFESNKYDKCKSRQREPGIDSNNDMNTNSCVKQKQDVSKMNKDNKRKSREVLGDIDSHNDMNMNEDVEQQQDGCENNRGASAKSRTTNKGTDSRDDMKMNQDFEKQDISENKKGNISKSCTNEKGDEQQDAFENKRGDSGKSRTKNKDSDSREDMKMNKEVEQQNVSDNNKDDKCKSRKRKRSNSMNEQQSPKRKRRRRNR